MGKKKKKGPSYRIVKNLPLGEGKGILITKKGDSIGVSGEVVVLNERQNLIVKKRSAGNPGCTRLSFSSGTRVGKWKPRSPIKNIQDR